VVCFLIVFCVRVFLAAMMDQQLWGECHTNNSHKRCVDAKPFLRAEH